LQPDAFLLMPPESAPIHPEFRTDQGAVLRGFVAIRLQSIHRFFTARDISESAAN
jgi:hypothetical protein